MGKWFVLLTMLVGLTCLPAPARAERAALPPTLVPLDSPEGQQMLLESSAREDFFRLVATYTTQEQPSYCGVASGVMVLNALPIAAPEAAEAFASFDQKNFWNEAGARLRPPEAVRRGGMTLETLAELLRTHPTDVEVHYASETTLDAFRELVKKNLSTADDYVVVNYQRSEVGQEPSGHFSPLAAYEAKTDRFLVMDVARYKYPPVWISAEALFRAMTASDIDSGKSRGFVVVKKAASAAPLGPPKPVQSRMMTMLAGALGLSFALGAGLGFGFGTFRARRKGGSGSSPH